MTALLTGCAQVDPASDFRRASQWITERTAAGEVYDPSTEATIQERIAALMSHGLTADEAVQVALLNNPGFQAIFQDIGVSRAEVVQSGLLSNPSLTTLIQFPEGGGRAKLSFGLAQQLSDLWQIPIRKKIAESELERTVLSVAQRAIQVSAETRTKYYELVASRRLVKLADENFRQLERTLDVAAKRFAAGEANLLEVNLVKITVLETRVDQLAVARDSRIAEFALARVLGVGRNPTELVAADELPTPRAELPVDDVLLERARVRRVDARMAELAIDAAEDELLKQCRLIFPNVTVGLEVERSERRALPGRDVLADTARASLRNGALTAPDIQTRAERRKERRQEIDAVFGPSFDITLPVFDQNQAQIAKARFTLARRAKEYDELLETVEAEIRTAAASARSANELAALYRDQVLPQAAANVESARALYQAGQQGILTVIEAETTLLGHRKRNVELARAYALAMVELDAATAGGVNDPGTPSDDGAGSSGTAPEPQEEVR